MFNRARLKLTVQYLLIIMVISLSFSAIIYQVLTFELSRFSRMQRMRLEHQLEGADFQVNNWSREGQRVLVTEALDPGLITETKQRLLFTLLAVNGVILVLAGGLGYLLAGKTLQPIQIMVDEQNQFISDASHELKTPLTALKTSLEIHQRDKNFNVKTAKKLIQGSLEEVAKLQKLTESLLQLAQFEELRSQPPNQPVDVRQVVKQALNQVEVLAKNKNIEIKDQVENVVVKGNFDQLSQLIVILLDNAIKYSPEKSTVNLKAKNINGRVILEVIDKGIGISSYNLPKIFDRFYQADSARTKNDNDSYGLGLSIAQKIVKVHGGQIEVESVEGKGSIFKVTLPVFS